MLLDRLFGANLSSFQFTLTNGIKEFRLTSKQALDFDSLEHLIRE